MSKTAITSPELTPPVGPFSQAIEVGGFLYFSGQVAQGPATGKMVEGGIVVETERIFPQGIPAARDAAIHRAGGNPQFRFDRKIRTSRFGSSA